MPEVYLERERKYDVDADAEVPSVTALLDGATDLPPTVDGPVHEHRLEATYLDTADLRLAAAGLTLRRRTGGEDAGWHLKVPSADGARLEVREPLGEGTAEHEARHDVPGEAPGDVADEVPDSLRRMVRAVARDGALVPVARISTTRTERRLVSTTGRVLAEVTDDRVTAERLVPGTTDGAKDGAKDGAADGTGVAGAGAASGWREVEVELVHGDEALLAALDTALQARGLRPAASASKLARVLDVRPTGRPSVRLRKRSTAGEVVLAHVAAQVARLREQDLPVRLDVDDSVHAMRVASRRLRSALTTFGPLFEPAAVDPLRDELRRLAAGLGGARDAEVMRERVLRAVAADHGPAAYDRPDDVTHDAVSQLDRAYREAHEEVLRLLDDDRHHRLLEALDAFVAAPPTRAAADERASLVLPRLVRSRYRRLRRLVHDARRASPGAVRDETLHDARKAAKRARYAAEAVQPVFGADARRFAAAMEEVQEVLGEHQDSVVTRARLRDLAAATSSPAAAFGYGRLDAQEQARGPSADDRLDAVWASARRRRLRRWLG